eukprot:CAMPEP_0194201464 /NCGR_PEP_ID=MMETSP0156-20130528/1726_1 /TAXON_ID=33649 /ORGANISM="Thalassionema nitzschioides, Strain L26-B" /LENGTH=341 /DNA_ID=CAMNT_0038926655 /DNA_START=122 /DNA_END=1147 /DNA_ORIENTATION=-
MTNETSSPDKCNAITPHSSDVLCGRGAAVNKHPGNVVFREIVKCNKALFHACPKEEKYFVAESIMAALQSQKPAVRFLEQNNNGVDLIWTAVSREKTIRKVFQALRERPSCAQQGFVDKTLSSDTTKRKKRKLLDQQIADDEENKDEEWNRMLRHLLPRSTPLLETAPTPEAEKDSGYKRRRAENDGDNKRRRVEKCETPKRESNYFSLSPLEEVTSSGTQSLPPANHIKQRNTLFPTDGTSLKAEDRDKPFCSESECVNHTELDDFQDKISQSIHVFDDVGNCDFYGGADLKIVDFQPDSEDYFECSESSLFDSSEVLLESDYLYDKNKSLFDESESIKV